jgi:RNA polymerase I-specific transcription initiation factor RRN7
VRDLWDLRIRGSAAFAAMEAASGTAAAGEEAELEVFSSQVSAPEDENEETIVKSTESRVQSWDAARGSAWPLPRVPDTLALCYLGCLLLRIPTRIAEIHEWASTGNLPYERAVSIQFYFFASMQCSESSWS